MSNNTFVPSGRFLTSSSPTRPLTIRIPAAPVHSEPLHPPSTDPPAPNLQAPNPPASTSTPTTSPFKIKLKLSPPKKPDPPKGPEKAPWPPVSEVQDRISKNPQLVIQNARLMLEDIRANGQAATLARPAMASRRMPSTNYESAHRFLLHKGALFPNEPMLHPKSRKPHMSKKRTSNGNGNDDSAEMDAPDVDVGASSDTSDAPASASPFRVCERPRKRARHGAPPERVTRDEAWRWAAVIGRIVKGKARLTPELIGEVNAALDAMEARKNDFTNEVLQEGVLDIVRLLSELQDNVYSLDGLRARARALVTAWSWIMTR